PEDADIPIHGYALSSEQFPDPATHTPIKCPLPRSGAALAALSSTKEDEGPAGFLARRSKLAAYALRRANGDRFLAIGYTLFLWGHARNLTSQGRVIRVEWPRPSTTSISGWRTTASTRRSASGSPLH